MKNLKLAVSQGFAKCKRATVKNAPTLFAIAGGVMSVTAIVLAVADTPYALDRLKEAKEEKGEDLTAWEKVKTAGPCYFDAALTEIGAISCIYASTHVSNRRLASLTAAYSMTEEAFKHYRDCAEKVVGTKKQRDIDEAVALNSSEKFVKEGEMRDDDFVFTGQGIDYIMDGFTGTKFRGSIDGVRSAFLIDGNMKLIRDGEIRIEDIYDNRKIGLKAGDYGAVAHVMGFDREKCKTTTSSDEQYIKLKTASREIRFADGQTHNVWIFTYVPTLLDTYEDEYDWRHWY